jgi:hypothetical protein
MTSPRHSRKYGHPGVGSLADLSSKAPLNRFCGAQLAGLLRWPGAFSEMM